MIQKIHYRVLLRISTLAINSNHYIFYLFTYIGRHIKQITAGTQKTGQMLSISANFNYRKPMT